jgi:hypothetical protein
MEYAGSGCDYQALPENGGVPIEANESINRNGGKVWLTSTDQSGRFKVGDTFAVDQQTGFVTIDPQSVATNLVSDTSPELGGDLDVLARNIYSSVGDIGIQDAFNTGVNLMLVRESSLTTAYPFVTQYDIGTDPNQVPLNGYLGTMAFQDSAGVNLGTATVGTLTVTDADATIFGVRVGRGAGADSASTSLGNGALAANTTGINNTATGYQALRSNTTGVNNTATGWGTLQANTTGIQNTANGLSALYANTTGNANTGYGQQALTQNTTGSNNTAVGLQSLFANTTGVNNTALGSNAAGAVTTGSYNVVIGSGPPGTAAGSALTTGSNNTIIGAIAGTAGLSDTVIIGAGSTEKMRIKANGVFNLPVAPVYADNAAATTGGLAVGDIYRTSTGQLMIRY